jgi:hypothetical protein
MAEIIKIEPAALNHEYAADVLQILCPMKIRKASN